MKNAIRQFISWQVRCSKWIDRKVFRGMSVDGNTYFVSFVARMVTDGASIADVGGGKTPAFSPEEVRDRHLEVTGIDVDPDELSAAPAGSYARTVVSAIEHAKGNADCDFVIAQSVMEHVNDGRLAALGMASFAGPGGTVATFCPNRRAWFARLNLILPESLKRRLLFAIFPEKKERQGFPAHYSGCTPSEMITNMHAAGVQCIEVKYFFVSSYFMFFVPFYLIWRVANLPFMLLSPRRYCETFIYVGRKVSGAPGA